jgi:propanol-preferring alcohol dehydrogenase
VVFVIQIYIRQEEVRKNIFYFHKKNTFEFLFFKELAKRPPLPLIIGHEGTGEIVELGSSVGDHIKKGDIIGVQFLQKSCLHCEYCLIGRETLCASPRITGFSTSGCFAEYVLMDADFAIKLPPDMDLFTSAPLFCAGLTVYKALKTSGARPGEWISIIGIGGLG